MRSQALRRRQNKLYMNKLPKSTGKEVVIIPSTQMASSNNEMHQDRAANCLQIGALSSKTEIEVAAWMGLQRDRNERFKEVQMHMDENGQKKAGARGGDVKQHRSAKPSIDSS